MSSLEMSIESERREERKWWRQGLNCVGNWLAHKNKDEWVEDMRGNLSLVATVIASLTFQNAINPPGGVRSPSDMGEIQCPEGKSPKNPCPGEAVLAVIYTDDYKNFLLSNTLCLISSLIVCLLLVSGFPLEYKFFTWLLSVGMCITLTSLTFTYIYGAKMVTPDLLWGQASNMFQNVLYIWIALLALITFVLCLRLMVWLVTKWIKNRKQG